MSDDLETSTDPPRTSGPFKTTLVGGLLFLLPIILITFLLGKALSYAKALSDPIVAALGIKSIAGVATGTLAAILVLVLICFVAGLLARTRLGQVAFARMEHSVLSVLPQWRMARGLLAGFDAEAHSEMEVVMVPTDAGWCLAFVLEKPEGDWWTVFVPGAPQWTSGSVAFAHRDQVKPAGLTFAQAILLLRRLGAGSKGIRALLSSLEERDAL